MYSSYPVRSTCQKSRLRAQCSHPLLMLRPSESVRCQARSRRSRVVELIASVCDVSARKSIEFTYHELDRTSGANPTLAGAILARHELAVVENSRLSDMLKRAYRGSPCLSTRLAVVKLGRMPRLHPVGFRSGLKKWDPR